MEEGKQTTGPQRRQPQQTPSLGPGMESNEMDKYRTQISRKRKRTMDVDERKKKLVIVVVVVCIIMLLTAVVVWYQRAEEDDQSEDDDQSEGDNESEEVDQCEVDDQSEEVDQCEGDDQSDEVDQCDHLAAAIVKLANTLTEFMQSCTKKTLTFEEVYSEVTAIPDMDDAECWKAIDFLLNDETKFFLLKKIPLEKKKAYIMKFMQQ